MRNIIIIIIAIIVISIILTEKNKQSMKREGFMTINHYETSKESRVMMVMRSMLKDVNGLLRSYGIRYWIDGPTLLAALLWGRVNWWRNGMDICISLRDKWTLERLMTMLNNMGYGMVKIWSGYRIYPLNGINVKYYRRKWYLYDKKGMIDTDDDVVDREFYNYKLPYLDILIYYNWKGRYRSYNKHVNRVWPWRYYDEDDLLPLREYMVEGIEILGPARPMSYLIKNFGYNLDEIYNRKDIRYVPLVKGKVR